MLLCVRNNKSGFTQIPTRGNNLLDEWFEAKSKNEYDKKTNIELCGLSHEKENRNFWVCQIIYYPERRLFYNVSAISVTYRQICAYILNVL